MLTRTLLIAIALLVAAGAWRLARWYWRPRLVLPNALVFERASEGIRVFLDVRNEGAGRSRGCRAVLIRCERQERIGWQRIEGKHSQDRGDPKRLKAGIPSHKSARIEIGVLNGEEKRSSYVVDMETVLPGVSP